MAGSEPRIVELSDEDMEEPPPVEEDDSADDDYHGTQEQPQDDDDAEEEDGDAMSLDDDNAEFAEASKYQDKSDHHHQEELSEPNIDYIDEFPPKKFEIQVVPPTLEELGASLDDYQIPDPPKVIKILEELNENGDLYYRARLKGGNVEKVWFILSPETDGWMKHSC